MIKEQCTETELCVCKECMKKFEESVNKMTEEDKKFSQRIDSEINGVYKDEYVGLEEKSDSKKGVCEEHVLGSFSEEKK